MKTLLSIFCFFLIANAQSQENAVVKESIKVRVDSMIVKDSAGMTYPVELWRKLLATGRYSLRRENTTDKNLFRLSRLTEEEFEKRKANIPKPKETTNFKTGSKFMGLSERDIFGDKVNSKTLKGKILVINFWFVACAPCVQEIPELNKLVKDYERDSSIVFIAIALDKPWDIKDFLKKKPFYYKIIGDGRLTAKGYDVRAYPTNLVVSPEGKIYFHTAGYSGFSTMHWIKKSIEELKKLQTADGSAESDTQEN